MPHGVLELTELTIRLDETPGRPGYRVGETETHFIDVLPMKFNWRLVLTPKHAPGTYDRAWCYYGTGPDAFARAVLAAWAWDGALDTEPDGWDKNAITGRYRQPGPFDA